MQQEASNEQNDPLQKRKNKKYKKRENKRFPYKKRRKNEITSRMR